MNDNFEEPCFREFNMPATSSGNIIKASDAHIDGIAKITIDDDTDEGIKVLLKKDENDSVKEIKFLCACGHTKTIILDYSE